MGEEVTDLLERHQSASTRLEEHSRIPLESGGTLSSNATLSARGLAYVGGSGSVRYVTEDTSWIEDATADLARWVTAGDDWDSYGARAISSHVAKRVHKLLRVLASAGVPRPFLTGTSGGGINLQWEIGHSDLQFSFEESGNDTAMYCDEETGVSWEGPVRKSTEFLRSMIARSASHD